MSHPVWVRGLKHVLAITGRVRVASHPVWVRGLKLFNLCARCDLVMSHPVWVRGLKQIIEYLFVAANLVAPRVGAWIETPANTWAITTRAASHPVWVRGLKLLFLRI